MIEQFVPYKMTKQLIELGCKTQKIAYISEKNQIAICTCECETDKESDWIYALLWQQAFSWLRKEHNLYIQIAPVKDVFIFDIINTNEDIEFHSYDFTTYDEALVHSILKAIELIQPKHNAIMFDELSQD